MQAAAFFPAGGQPGFRFKFFIKADAVLQHAGDVAFFAKLSDKSGRMPGGTTGQVVLFKQHHVFATHLR